MRSRRRDAWYAAGGVFCLAIFVRLPFLHVPGFPADQTQFVMWSGMARTAGLAELYRERPDRPGRRWCNYPPAYLYVLRGLASWYERSTGRPIDAALIRDVFHGDPTADVRTAAAVFKRPAVLADALTGALLALWLAGRMSSRRSGLIGLAYVLLPAVVHNSAVWGQVDAVPTLLTLASLELARRRRLTAMWAFAALAVLTKAQAIAIAPVWMIATFVIARARRRAVIPAAAVTLAIVVAVLAPFHRVRDGVWQAYAGASRYYPHTHLNGFSAWFLADPMIEPNLNEMAARYARDDAPTRLGLTPRHIGLFGFGAAAVYVSVQLWRRRCDDHALFLAARTLPLAFFVLSTQMHERYVFPALAIWVWAYRPTARWWGGWIVLAACASINILWAWPGPPDRAIVRWMAEALHTSWLGASPGVWCAAATLLVLIASVTGWADAGARPVRESAAPR